MTEKITKAELIDSITSIIAGMDILDSPSMQRDDCGITFACLGHSTRNQLRELADRLNRCELEESGERVAESYREGIKAAFDALSEASESLKLCMGDGKADMNAVLALAQVTSAMCGLLGLMVCA